MRYVEVRYKCKCMRQEVAVQVPERHQTDDVTEWVRETMGRVIARDHQARSPLCRADTMEYAKIPVDGDFIGQAKGGVA